MLKALLDVVRHGFPIVMLMSRVALCYKFICCVDISGTDVTQILLYHTPAYVKLDNLVAFINMYSGLSIPLLSINKYICVKADLQ